MDLQLTKRGSGGSKCVQGCWLMHPHEEGSGLRQSEAVRIRFLLCFMSFRRVLMFFCISFFSFLRYQDGVAAPEASFVITLRKIVS